MFKKKYCPKCGNKINSKYKFCPYCGNRINENSEKDFGMLGKTDSVNEKNVIPNSIFGGVGGKMINRMLGSAMKMLEKEMQKEQKIQQMPSMGNMKLMINGKEINLNNAKIPEKKLVKKIQQIKLPQNVLKNFSDLEKQEPLANIRRFSDKVVYEIEMPGVKSIKDVSISKLEKSIEVKAVAKNKAYFKIIRIGLSVINYKFSKDNLILEFEAKN